MTLIPSLEAMKGIIRPFNCFFFFLIYPSIFLGSVKSEVYIVGGNAEEWNTGVNYLTWSQKYNFIIGDILVFNYVKGQHDTCEVTEATYRSCNSSTGVLARYESGNDKITLNEAKKYWFICDIPGHCLGGMRFGIDVNDNTSTSHSASDAQQTPQPIPNQNSSCAAMKTSGAVVLVNLVALLLKVLA